MPIIAQRIEKKAKSVMVNNFTNINKTNNHLLPVIIAYMMF